MKASHIVTMVLISAIVSFPGGVLGCLWVLRSGEYSAKFRYVELDTVKTERVFADAILLGGDSSQLLIEGGKHPYIHLSEDGNDTLGEGAKSCRLDVGGARPHQWMGAPCECGPGCHCGGRD